MEPGYEYALPPDVTMSATAEVTPVVIGDVTVELGGEIPEGPATAGMVSEVGPDGQPYPHVLDDPDCRIAQTLDGVVWVWDVCAQRFLFALLPKPSGGYAIYDVMALRWEINPERGMQLPPMLTGPDQEPPLWALHHSGLFRAARAAQREDAIRREWVTFGIAMAVAAWLLRRW